MAQPPVVNIICNNFSDRIGVYVESPVYFSLLHSFYRLFLLKFFHEVLGLQIISTTYGGSLKGSSPHKYSI